MGSKAALRDPDSVTASVPQVYLGRNPLAASGSIARLRWLHTHLELQY